MRLLGAVVFCLLTSFSLWCDVFSLSVESQIAGYEALAGNIKAREGEMQTISYKETTLKLRASEIGDDIVRVDAELLLEKEQGQTLIAQPIVVVQLGRTAEVSGQDCNDLKIFSLKITVVKENGP